MIYFTPLTTFFGTIYPFRLIYVAFDILQYDYYDDPDSNSKIEEPGLYLEEVQDEKRFALRDYY